MGRLDDAMLAGVQQRSDYIFRTLTGKPGIKAVTGLGLMVGIETEKPASEVIAACMARGVLVLSAHGKVRLLPALNIPMDLLQKAVDVIVEACA